MSHFYEVAEIIERQSFPHELTYLILNQLLGVTKTTQFL